MNSNIIFYPVLAHIYLILWLYGLLAVRKKRAIQQGKVDRARRPLYEDAWPDDVVVVNNSLRNQFQVPMLFYSVCFMLWATDSVNAWVLLLSGLFVLSRYLHALVHTGPNIVRTRFRLFTIGFGITVVLGGYALVVVVLRTL